MVRKPIQHSKRQIMVLVNEGKSQNKINMLFETKQIKLYQSWKSIKQNASKVYQQTVKIIYQKPQGKMMVELNINRYIAIFTFNYFYFANFNKYMINRSTSKTYMNQTAKLTNEWLQDSPIKDSKSKVHLLALENKAQENHLLSRNI